MTDISKIFRQLQNNVLTVRANLFAARPGERTAMHRHPRRWHISCVIRGQGVAVVNGARHHLRPGAIIMIYPNEPHLYAADKTTPYTVHHVHIDCADGIPAIFPRLTHAATLDKAVLNEFKKLTRLTHQATSPTRAPRAMAALCVILAELYDANHQHAPDDGAMPGRVDASAKKLSAILERLQTVPFTFPGIAPLAESMRMSRRHFTRYFRRHTGMSVREYYTAGMMTYAQNLMALREYTLKEIAWQCGFANSQNFHRAWRRHVRTAGGEQAP